MRENTKLIFQTLRRKWEHTISWMAPELECFTDEMIRHAAGVIMASQGAQVEE